MIAHILESLHPIRKTQMRFLTPGFGLAVAGVWGVNQQIKDLDLSYSNNKNRNFDDLRKDYTSLVCIGQSTEAEK